MEAPRPNLDTPPAGPPEMRVRKGISGMVASRDAEQNGPAGMMPGMGGTNAIAMKAMAAEQALGELAQVLPDPAPIAEIVARLRAAVVPALQSGAGSPTPPQGGMAGIVAPPPPISPPAMGGAGMPPPPLQ